MKAFQHILRLLSAVFVVLMFAGSLLADEKPVGSVVALRGKVTAVNPDGAHRSLAVKSKIYLADTINTGRQGRVQMMFDDNTLISLGPNTAMEIAEYQWNPDKKNGAMKTRVSEGVFRIMGGAITQSAPRNFNTETPAGTIGIRGSMYAGKVSGSSLHLLFQGGKGIFVTNAAGTVSIDRPGFGTFVEGPDTPPTAPTRFSSEDLAVLEDTVAVRPVDSDGDDDTQEDTESQSPAGSDGDGDAQEGTGSQNPAGSDGGDDAEEGTGSQSSTDFNESELAAEETGLQDPANSDEGGGMQEGADIQSALGTDSPTEGSEDLLSDQEQWASEASGETVAAAENSLPADTVTVADLQSAVVENSVDAVKDVASDTVVDGIQTVRQEEVLATEQAILELLLEMGFVGGRSLNVPVDGIDGFDGALLHKHIEGADFSRSPAKMVVNWYNKKFFGIVEEEIPSDNKFPVFIFGDVNGTALENLQVVGSGFDLPVNRVSAISGSGTFGQFYGTDTDAAGFAMEGVDVNVENQSDRQAWEAYGAAIRIADPPPSTPIPTGTQYMSGFVLGVAEDMSAPEVNRRIFMNTQAGDFRFNVNKDTGSISGSMSATDFNSTFSAITNLQIGGSLASAYVLDDAMIALLGGAGSITTGGSAGGLKEYGNYMVTAKQPDQLAPYTTWGYWEIAYRDPAYGIDYHVHHPGSIWIAGSQTPAAEVSSLISTNFIGTYTGGAEGIRIDPGGMMSQLSGGATNLTIDFNPSATMPVMGRISFDQVNLNVISSPGAVTTNGFAAEIGGATTSRVNGAFFGPNARAVGGNFGARMSSGDDYYGIFAGSR
ncbi:MAG: FecR domain-containing protein [Desulfobacterales bacterium]|nr:MAG: FecR domain-containing protein [Desulfobacterales bacterium]